MVSLMRSKLVVILEIKGVQNLKLEKTVLIQKWSSKFILLNEKKKIPLTFYIENRLLQSDYGLF